jgi:hypothetical protein
MSNKLSAVLVLCMSTLCLSGCDLLRVTGPCYGVGCPAGTPGRSGQYKEGEGPKAQTASAPAQTASAPAKTAALQSKAVQPNASTQATTARAQTAPSTAEAAHAQPTSAQATTAPAQDANSEAKPSPFHAIGEFFARLIPHRNSSGNSGASN